MTFEPSRVPEFISVFNASKHHIRAFDGCEFLELHRDPQNPAVLVTLSHWKSEAHLNHYRESALFKETWSKTKTLFSAKPIAFSLESVEKIEKSMNFSENQA